MTSKVTLEKILISRSGDKCISAGEESTLLITQTLVDSCQIGLAVKDNSEATIDGMSFSNQRGESIALYNKNPRYSVGGKVTLKRASGISESAITADRRSAWSLAHDATVDTDVDWENLQAELYFGPHSETRLKQIIESLR